MRWFISLLLLFFILQGQGIELDEQYDYSEELPGISITETDLENLELFPVNINGGDISRLEMIPGINIKELAKLEKLKKNISSPADLLSSGFSAEFINLISPYISYSSVKSTRLNGQIFCMTEDFAANSWRSKWQLSAHDIKFGFMVKRTKGEKLKDIYFPFFFEYHCYPLKVLCGSYSLRWGQGLLHGSALHLSSRGSAGGIIRRNRSLARSCLGSYESGINQGAALQYNHKNYFMDFFFSERGIGVNFSDSLSISSFCAEIPEDRQRTVERLYGSAISYKSPAIDLGFLAEKVEFCHKIESENSWQRFLACSGWLDLRFQSLQAGGEYALAAQKGAGIIYASYGNSKLRQFLYLRHYRKGFPDMHGNPVSRKSPLGGQEGIYYGLSFQPAGWVEINFYGELYNFFADRYLVELPSGGSENMLNLIIGEKDHNLEIFGRYRNSDQYHAFEDSSEVVEEELIKLQVSINQTLGLMKLRTRLGYKEEYLKDFAFCNNGFYIYQQAGWKSANTSFWLRITGFRTRLPLYMYENSCRSGSKQVCVNGDGYRFAFLLKHRIKSMIFEVKYTYEYNEENNGHELGFELKWTMK